MTISITRYVNITSGVGGQAGVPRRNFMLRQFTQNALIPAGAVVTFSNLADVRKYFGSAADEYKVAEKYFGFVSKTISSPDAMSIAGWNSVDLAPAVYGGAPLPLSAIKQVTAGTMTIKVSGVDALITGLNFAAAANMAAVAGILQTAIRLNADPQLTTATVTYESNRGVFILHGAVAGAGSSLAIVATVLSTDTGVLVGWATGEQIEAEGTDAQEPVDAFLNSQSSDDNFGSFVFSGAAVPTAEQNEAVSAANHTLNNKFIFALAVTAADAVAVSEALLGYSGTALTLVPTGATADHAETVPSEILAAINWDRPGASQNFMYYRFGNRVPTVNDNPGADKYDALRVNYVGQTQTAGQKIAFYQTGFLMGDETTAVDMAVYTGEMWLKDSITSGILGGFLALPTMPANSDGRITVLSLMQGPLDQALVNGVISVGKTLDNTQKAYITQITGSPDAWRQVESKGYWVDAFIRSEVKNNVTVYSADYILVYGKNDQLRKVTGSDVLI